MYGAGGTPLTDESDDDDQNNGSGARGGGYMDTNNTSDYSGGGGNGGFTENVLDETNISNTNHGNAWDDDNNDDEDHNMNGTENENWIDIMYEGQSFIVPLSDDVRTFGDIKRWLLSHQQEYITNIELTSSHHIIDPDMNDHEYQDDDDAMIANHKKLLIRWNCFLITIMDGADFKEDIQVAEDFSIQRIKATVEKNHNIRLDQLSKDGLELQNDKTLREYNICDNGHTLISRILIEIIDRECDLSTDILVCEFWSIEDVLNVYLQSSRRERHQAATMSLNDQILDFQSTVSDENILNRSQIIYVVNKYKVLVYDSEMGMNNMMGNNGNNGQDQQCVEIEVMDNQTISEIQEYYARLTRKPFMKNDKLLSNEQVLEFNVPLYKLRLKDNEPLIIEREQQQKPAEYICAECGAVVSLRPYDAVQCRECFMSFVVLHNVYNHLCCYISMYVYVYRCGVQNENESCMSVQL